MSWYSSSSTTRYFAALERAHLGLLGGQPRAERDLVGEVHQPELRLQPAVALDQAEQLLALAANLLEHLRDRRSWPASAASAASNSGPLRASNARTSLGADEVLGQLAVEREQVVDHGLGCSLSSSTAPVCRSIARAASW